MGLSHTDGSPNLGQKIRPFNNQQKKKEFAKKCEKKDNYRDLANELKKLWNMMVTIIPNVISTFGTFGTFTKGLLKGLEDSKAGGRVDTI